MQFRPLVDRFSEKYVVDASTGCWKWAGSTVNGGYGMINAGRGAGNILAHRASYAIHVGEIPDGMLVLHRCDNPSCVNPKHLFLGDHNDNMKDMARKGRGKTPKLKRTKRFLDDGKRKAIISLLVDKRPVAEIARQMQVDRKTVRNVRAAA